MAIASLVLGIISILLGLFGGMISWTGILFGIIGIVLGVMGRKNPTSESSSGLATAGLVCSIIGLVLSSIIFIACVACTAGLASISAF